MLLACTVALVACRSAERITPELPAAVAPAETPVDAAAWPLDDPALRPNLAHLEHLYDEIVLPRGDTGGVVWIYCEAPDYRLLDDDDEGYTCVDDMARALVAYGLHHELRGDALSRRRVGQLARTILSLQADNGYFYNFLWPDNTINRTFRTSVAVPDWWSWRALWALEWALAQGVLDARGAAAAKTACDRLVGAILRDFPPGAPARDTVVGGVRLPADLPGGAGFDQTAVLLMGLSLHFTRTQHPAVATLAQRFAGRLQASQARDGRFPSWYDYWHAWGNLQAFALGSSPLAVGGGVQARIHADTFVPRYLRERSSAGRCGGGAVGSHDARSFAYCDSLPEAFPQIAYGQRPFVWSAVWVYGRTGDVRYRGLGVGVARWFAGDNVAGVAMYEAATGRGYDGIVSATEVNYNAGAESTIEALLSVLAVQGAFVGEGEGR